MNDAAADNGRLVAVVSEVLLHLRGRRTLIVCAFVPDRETARRLLAIPGAIGLMLPAKPEGLDDETRIWFRPGLAHRRWNLPADRIDEILIVGGPHDVGRRGRLLLLWRGFWRVWFADPVTGQFARRRILTMDVPLFVRRATELVRRETYQRSLGFLFVRVLARRRPVAVHPARGSVLLVIGTLGPGGSERQVVNTAIGLKRDHGIEPLVACTDLVGAAQTFYRPLLREAGIDCVDIGARKGEDGTLQALGLRSFWRLVARHHASRLDGFMALIEEHRPEVVHSFLDPTNVFAGIAAVACGTPRVILNMRSVAPDNFWQDTYYLRMGYRLLARRTGAVFCNNSEAGAADYQRWLSMPNLDIAVVPNGIDLSTFEPCPEQRSALRERHAIPREALVLGGVMRFTSEKRPELWARSAVEISRRHPDTWFVLAGDGPMLPQVRGIFERARMLSRVRLLGRTVDIASVYRMLDLLLLTSRSEGLPNALIEAQATGVPVVTTRAGGAGEAIRPGVTGLVADDDTPVGLARLCLGLLEDGVRRAAMAAAAPGWVRRQFDLQTMLARTLALYRSEPFPEA